MMPKVSGKEPIHMIYSPAHRRQSYPHCAWDFLLYVARNIASSLLRFTSTGTSWGRKPEQLYGRSRQQSGVDR